jgi:hypothetical protein
MFRKGNNATLKAAGLAVHTLSVQFSSGLTFDQTLNVEACLNQTAAVQKRKYKACSEERERERESCVIKDLASLDACPQAGSPVKDFAVFELKPRQNQQATAQIQ